VQKRDRRDVMSPLSHEAYMMTDKYSQLRVDGLTEVIS